MDQMCNTTASTILGGSGIQERTVGQGQIGEAEQRKIYKDWDSAGKTKKQQSSTRVGSECDQFVHTDTD